MFIRLFWWNKKKTKDGLYNYGDLMSKYIVHKISNKIIIPSNHKHNKIITKFFKNYHLCIGSILFSASKNSKVWGSGILNRNEMVCNAKFYAVRGPKTRNRLLELGYEVPEVYGDPALLLPKFIKNEVTQNYEIGVIPHFVDYKLVSQALKHQKNIKVIKLLTSDVEQTTKAILECKYIISSSLHGLIVPHAYNIPALWVKFSNNLSGDNIKFYDYYSSVNINFKDEIFLKIESLNFKNFIEILKNNKQFLLPESKLILSMQKQLLAVCPF